MAEFEYVSVSEIHVERETRQRRQVDPGDLVESVRRHGVLNPLIIRRQGMLLVAGERRLEAARAAELEEVPVRFFEDLSDLEAEIIELEENLRRTDLPWQDEARSIARLHQRYMESKPKWTQEKTGEALILSYGTISKTLRVVEDMHIPQVAAAPSLHAAFNVLSRKDERAFGDFMNDIADASAEVLAPEPMAEPLNADFGLGRQSPMALAPAPRPEDESILHANFLDWIETYSGPRFNFVHCDFPYGINVFHGEQSGRDKWTHYDDSPDTYWRLIEGFCKHLDRFMAPEAHLFFWLAADIEIQHETLRRFAALAPGLAFQTYPLIWVKSDNVGLLPDPKRGPRRIYETALIASREDRLIAKAVSNAYSAPTDKAHHPSTKPEPMLRHFFQMFVDESTTLFDPTCGSGAAIRAALSLGAKRALGLEIDEEHAQNARSALRAFRTRQAMAKLV